MRTTAFPTGPPKAGADRRSPARIACRWRRLSAPTRIDHRREDLREPLEACPLALRLGRRTAQRHSGKPVFQSARRPPGRSSADRRLRCAGASAFWACCGTFAWPVRSRRPSPTFPWWAAVTVGCRNLLPRRGGKRRRRERSRSPGSAAALWPSPISPAACKRTASSIASESAARFPTAPT